MQSRSQPKRRFLALATVSLAALVGVSLAGCSSSSGGSTSKTITVQVQSGSDAVIQSFIKVFQKQNPGTKVKTTAVSQTAKTGSNLQVLTSSSAPDVAIVPTNTQAFTTLTTGNQLVPLDSVWKSANLDKRYGSSLASALKTGGTPYVVSYDSTIYNVVYYNKAMFSSLGIQAPANHHISSLSELESIVSKLKAGGKQGLAIGPADNYQSSWMVDAFLPTTSTTSQLDNYLSSWQPKTKVTAKYTDPAFTDALAQIQKMGKAGVFQDGYLGQKVTQAEALFVQGQTGMLLDGNYSADVLKKDGIQFDYGWATLPPAGSLKKTQLTLYNGDAYAIPVKAKNPELAKKFLEAMMSVDGQTSLIANGSLPSVNDIPTSAYSGLAPQVQEQLAEVKKNGGQPGWTSVIPGGLGQQFIDPLIQEMLNGNGSPANIGQSVQQQLIKTRSASSK